MKRRKFVRNSFLGMLAAAFTPAIAKETNESTSPLNNLVGFEHIPATNEKNIMKKVIHRAADRGHANHGWLDTHHTFSFANYYNPERMRFGMLRVLNDDIIDGGTGFGTHPHDNMEIISIPIDGALEHKDSMGNTHVIRQNDIQVMSAGSGIYHSEYNKEKDKKSNFLQIWVFPNKKNVKPRYDQITFKPDERKNKLQQIVSPHPDDEGVWIHQDAWFHLGVLDKDFETSYHLKKDGNGLYVFVIEGKVEIAGEALNRRDGIGLWEADDISIKALDNAEVLLMEVPMR